MNWMYALILLIALHAAQVGNGAMASSDASASTVARMELGSKNNQMRFFPQTVRLWKGEAYKLIIHNPSPVMHEFDAPQLAKFVRSRKVEVRDGKGRLVAEIHGTAPREMVVAPFSTVEWYFVAMRTSGKLTFICDLPGHRAAGMVGVIWIE